MAVRLARLTGILLLFISATGLVWIIETAIIRTYNPESAVSLLLNAVVALTSMVDHGILTKVAGPAKAVVLSAAIYFVLAKSGISRALCGWYLERLGCRQFCRQCFYPLDEPKGECVRCPECGTLNDASKWLINREGESRQEQGNVGA